MYGSDDDDDDDDDDDRRNYIAPRASRCCGSASMVTIVNTCVVMQLLLLFAIVLYAYRRRQAAERIVGSVLFTACTLGTPLPLAALLAANLLACARRSRTFVCVAIVVIAAANSASLAWFVIATRSQHALILATMHTMTCLLASIVFVTTRCTLNDRGGGGGGGGGALHRQPRGITMTMRWRPRWRTRSPPPPAPPPPLCSVDGCDYEECTSTEGPARALSGNQRRQPRRVLPKIIESSVERLTDAEQMLACDVN